MRKAEYWKDELQGAFYVAGLFLFGASILVALAAAFIFFVQGCVPALLATSNKAAEYYIEKIGEDPDEYRLAPKPAGKPKKGGEGDDETSQPESSD